MKKQSNKAPKMQSNKVPKLPDLKTEVCALLLSAARYLERTPLLYLLGEKILRDIDDDAIKVYEEARAIAANYVRMGITS